jgi:hypothetical protein
MLTGKFENALPLEWSKSHKFVPISLKDPCSFELAGISQSLGGSISHLIVWDCEIKVDLTSKNWVRAVGQARFQEDWTFLHFQKERPMGQKERLAQGCTGSSSGKFVILRKSTRFKVKMLSPRTLRLCAHVGSRGNLLPRILTALHGRHRSARGFVSPIGRLDRGKPNRDLSK